MKNQSLSFEFKYNDYLSLSSVMFEFLDDNGRSIDVEIPSNLLFS